MNTRVALLTASLALLLANRASAEVDFVKDVKPILEGTCMKCHVGEKPRGGLRMDTKENLLKGGKLVKVVLVPGKADKSGVLAIRLAQNTNLLRVDFSLRGKEVKDEDLLLLKDMPNLTELNLGGTTITDSSLVHLKPLKNLTRLQLHNTKISDAGLVNLQEMTKLKSLNLYGCAGVTDMGLEHLKGLKELKKLYLWQTKVTEPGATKLSGAIAGLYVDRGYDAEVPKPKDPPKEKK